jgi:hypothetical protein
MNPLPNPRADLEYGPDDMRQSFGSTATGTLDALK